MQVGVMTGKEVFFKEAEVAETREGRIWGSCLPSFLPT